MLDHQPLDGVGVVAAPDLGEVGQHARVEASAAARAALKQHMGEAGGQGLQQPVNAQHVPVGRFALPLGGQHPAVHVGHVPVHVPFHIGDGVVGQQVGQPLGQVVHHLGAAHVQHHLVAAHHRGPARQGEGPVRMRPVQVGILAYHLRLHPDAELHAQRVHPLNQGSQPAGQLFLVHEPVA